MKRKEREFAYFFINENTHTLYISPLFFTSYIIFLVVDKATRNRDCERQIKLEVIYLPSLYTTPVLDILATIHAYYQELNLPVLFQ